MVEQIICYCKQTADGFWVQINISWCVFINLKRPIVEWQFATCHSNDCLELKSVFSKEIELLYKILENLTTQHNILLGKIFPNH